ncbi:hypothetical protein C8R44DRAFT_808425 [Mycena epipterygia]|nr:hypothetical protein C8R44DRAFT_808425 [Mycena epipterygia]
MTLTHDFDPSVASDKDDEDNESFTSESYCSTIVEDLNRVEDLWFEEDNLIIRAENSIFRVSRGVLAARSPVFRSMLFDLPKPNPERTIIMYGCPVIQLRHSPEDVTYFLKAIFDSEFFLPPPAKSSFWAVLGVLRLAHDYDVHYLVKRALRHFETFFPSVLDGKRVYVTIVEGSEPTVLSCDLVLAALQVGAEVGASWNLPSVIYECCTFSLADILDSDQWVDLPASHKRTLILSHENQKYGASMVSQFLFADYSSGCKNYRKCSSGRLHWLKTMDNWCKESYAREREVFWEALPKTFGLPGWNELNKMKGDMFPDNESK